MIYSRNAPYDSGALRVALTHSTNLMFTLQIISNDAKEEIS